MDSLWTATAQMPSFEPLSGAAKTDVLIIGGGIAGILCAHFLKQAGIPYLLVEADRIGGGITKNTTAKITSQHGFIARKVLSKYGPERAKLYLQANQEALAQYRKMCTGLDCDFSPQDNFVYSKDDPKKLEQELAALRQLGFPGQWVQELPLPFPTAGAIRFQDQAQFHPLKFLRAVSRELNIREHTRVLELMPNTVVTNRGTIRAKKIIVATHFPLLNKHGSYFLKLYQHRSYVLALENAPDIKGMYVDEAKTGMSFRNAGGLLLLGGGGHRTGKPGGSYPELEAFARKHYPQASIRYRWATQDCISLDGVPYIGPYSRRTKDLFVATGFNKWGMTTAMAAAQILTDLVQDKPNPYATVFSPSRRILHPQLALNGFESATNLLTPTRRRCPHLGCALKWNPQEHTWDCPCHGSRFTEEGYLIDNPATGDLKQ